MTCRLLPATVLVFAFAFGCVRPGDERALLDLEVGLAEAGGIRFEVAGHLAAVQQLAPGTLVLRAQAPVLELHADADADASQQWTITIHNALADAELVGDGGAVVQQSSTGQGPTIRQFTVQLPPGQSSTLRLQPPDHADQSPWRYAFMADIQTGVDQVDDLFERMNRDPQLRFVIAAGDLVHRGDPLELPRVLEKLRALDIPFYTTIGNHELFQPDSVWQELIGARNFHFAFRGVHFSFADSANASLDPLVYERLDDWLRQGQEMLHVFVTHIPPFDPIGVRNAGFRSRKEAAKLYRKLAGGGVDLVLLGHIHSYYAYAVAGIPTYISGGGGAAPAEYWDNIGRHYLAVEVDPIQQLLQVAVVRIDSE